MYSTFLYFCDYSFYHHGISNHSSQSRVNDLERSQKLNRLALPDKLPIHRFSNRVPQKASTNTRRRGRAGSEKKGERETERKRKKEERREWKRARERRRERALRTEERVVSSRVPRRAVGSIVLLREVDHSLSLSHAALIAHRSPIYRAGARTS